MLHTFLDPTTYYPVKHILLLLLHLFPFNISAQNHFMRDADNDCGRGPYRV